jgi:hypothetical protein
MRKIDLRYFHVHKITGRLHSLDSEITQSFVDAHRTLTFRSTALYLQGVFFNTNTAVVQMPEAMVLVLMVLAKHQDVQQRLRQGSEETYLNRVLTETMRLYPLFGIAHRITSADIVLENGVTV